MTKLDKGEWTEEKAAIHKEEMFFILEQEENRLDYKGAKFF